jgi:hypothetical protein
MVGLPSASSLIHELVFKYNFNDNSAKDFVKVFGETIAYAGLTGGENEENQAPTMESLSPIQGQSSSGVGAASRSEPPQRQLEAGMQEAIFPLAEGTAVVKWPVSMSLESYEEFEDWIKLTLRRAKRAAAQAGTSTDGEASEP